jgi:hypothetical protein
MEINSLKHDLEQQKNDYNSIQQELTAVNHHRNILCDTVDQLDQQCKQKNEIVVDLQAQIESLSISFNINDENNNNNNIDFNNNVINTFSSQNRFSNSINNNNNNNNKNTNKQQEQQFKTEDEESLRRQITRFKARAIAAEEVANIYRISVLALYANGASYGAAQYGWQPHGDQQEFSTKGFLKFIL